MKNIENLLCEQPKRTKFRQKMFMFPIKRMTEKVCVWGFVMHFTLCSPILPWPIAPHKDSIFSLEINEVYLNVMM